MAEAKSETRKSEKGALRKGDEEDDVEEEEGMVLHAK
jgi:hypothetical protein